MSYAGKRRSGVTLAMRHRIQWIVQFLPFTVRRQARIVRLFLRGGARIYPILLCFLWQMQFCPPNVHLVRSAVFLWSSPV